MSAPAYSSARLQRLYKAGLCIRCSAPHSLINPNTKRPQWRCADCNSRMVSMKHRRRTLKAMMANAQPRRPLKRLVPVNLPNAIYTQHDPIAARYRWGAVR